MPDIPWYVFALLGAFFVSLASVFEKKALIHDEPFHFSASSTAFVGLLSLPFLFFVNWAVIPPIAYAILFGISLLSMLAFSLVAYSLRCLEAGEQSLILALTPAATAVLAFAFLGEALTEQAAAGLLLVVVGLIVLEYPSARACFKGQKLHKKVLPVLASLGAVLAYAVSALGDRIALHGYAISPIDFLAIVQAMALVNFCIIALFDRSHKKLLVSSILRQPAQLIVFSVCLFLSRLAYAQAVSMAYVALAAALKRTGALFTIVMARAYLKERNMGHKLLAGSIIIAGVICIILQV